MTQRRAHASNATVWGAKTRGQRRAVRRARGEVSCAPLPTLQGLERKGLPLVIVVMVVSVTVMMMLMIIMMMMMIVPVIMMMNALGRAAASRILAEHQRFDRHRHGIGRHPDASEIDVVEVAQHHAVDREDLARDLELLAQDRSQGLRDVAVEHDVERLAARDRPGEAAADAFREGGDALVGRRSRLTRF